eukprot:366153-Chlamydomonas_euryale.AAC.5
MKQRALHLQPRPQSCSARKGSAAIRRKCEAHTCWLVTPASAPTALSAASRTRAQGSASSPYIRCTASSATRSGRPCCISGDSACAAAPPPLGTAHLTPPPVRPAPRAAAAAAPKAAQGTAMDVCCRCCAHTQASWTAAYRTTRARSCSPDSAAARYTWSMAACKSGSRVTPMVAAPSACTASTAPRIAAARAGVSTRSVAWGR